MHPDFHPFIIGKKNFMAAAIPDLRHRRTWAKETKG